MKIIKLTFTGKEPVTTCVNVDNIANFTQYGRGNDLFTQINFNFSIGGFNSGNGAVSSYSISVKETPDEIIQLINE